MSGGSTFNWGFNFENAAMMSEENDSTWVRTPPIASFHFTPDEDDSKKEQWLTPGLKHYIDFASLYPSLASLYFTPDEDDSKKKEHKAGEMDMTVDMLEPPTQAEFECCLCLCVMRDAVQCDNGSLLDELDACRHTACLTCMKEAISQNSKCPVCRQATSVAHLIPHFQLRKRIRKSRITCPECKDSKILVGEFAQHRAECAKPMVTCARCRQTMRCDMLHAHQALVCAD